MYSLHLEYYLYCIYKYFHCVSLGPRFTSGAHAHPVPFTESEGKVKLFSGASIQVPLLSLAKLLLQKLCNLQLL